VSIPFIALVMVKNSKLQTLHPHYYREGHAELAASGTPGSARIDGAQKIATTHKQATTSDSLGKKASRQSGRKETTLKQVAHSAQALWLLSASLTI